MTKNEKYFLNSYLGDKKEELVKCLDHYTSIDDKTEIEFFKAQIRLLNEITKDLEKLYL